MTTPEQQFQYTLQDGTIRHDSGHMSEEKDIGVIIDSNLEFDKDVYVKDNKANSSCSNSLRLCVLHLVNKNIRMH